MKNINFLKLELIPVCLFAGFSLWWVLLHTIFIEDENKLELFSATYGSLALVGSIWGMYVSTLWNGWRSYIGKFLILFSLGLLFQEFGQISYSYYTYIKGIEIPYPSLGDIGYFGSIPLYITGIWFLLKSISPKKSLNRKTIVPVIIIPIAMLIFSYFEFLQGYEFDWANPLVVFLDFGYPFGQAIYISIAILSFILSGKYLGGRLKTPVMIILAALVCQYIADFTFLYQVSRETWTTAGINDYMYLFSYFVMTLGLIQFNNVLEKLKVGEPKPVQVENVSVPIQNSEVTVQ